MNELLSASMSGMMFYIWMTILVMSVMVWYCYRNQSEVIKRLLRRPKP